MSAEVPKVCETCPVVHQCQTTLASLEENEDRMIMDLMGTEIEDSAHEWAEAGVQLMVPDESGEWVAVPFTAELARTAAAEHLNEVQAAIRAHSEMLARYTAGCMGALALSAEDGGIKYDVTVCRSPQNDRNMWFDEEDIADDDGKPVDDQKVHIALIKRKTIAESEAESLPEVVFEINTDDETEL